MRDWLGLSVGFPRRCACVTFFALSLCSGVVQAQDVLVFPPGTNAAPATPSVFSTNESPAAAPAAPPDVVSPPPMQLAREAPAPGLTGSPIPDQPTKQCMTDADCVLSDGGCQAVEAVNKNKDAAWRTQMARSQPGCVGLPAPMMQQVAQAVKPVCRENRCVSQVIKAGK